MTTSEAHTPIDLRIQDIEQRASRLMASAHAAMHEGQLNDAVEHIRRACEILRPEPALRENLCTALQRLGIVSCQANKHFMAIYASHEALDIGKGLFSKNELAFVKVQFNYAASLQGGGYYSKAEQLLEALLGDTANSITADLRLRMYWNLSYCILMRDDFEAARAKSKEGLEVIEDLRLSPSDSDEYKALFNAIICESLIRLNREQEALNLIRSAKRGANAFSWTSRQLLETIQGFAEVASGMLDLGFSRLKSSLEACRNSGASQDDALRILVAAHELVGDHTNALSYLSELDSLLLSAVTNIANNTHIGHANTFLPVSNDLTSKLQNKTLITKQSKDFQQNGNDPFLWNHQLLFQKDTPSGSDGLQDVSFKYVRTGGPHARLFFDSFLDYIESKNFGESSRHRDETVVCLANGLKHCVYSCSPHEITKRYLMAVSQARISDVEAFAKFETDMALSVCAISQERFEAGLSYALMALRTAADKLDIHKWVESFCFVASILIRSGEVTDVLTGLQCAEKALNGVPNDVHLTLSRLRIDCTLTAYHINALDSKSAVAYAYAAHTCLLKDEFRVSEHTTYEELFWMRAICFCAAIDGDFRRFIDESYLGLVDACAVAPVAHKNRKVDLAERYIKQEAEHLALQEGVKDVLHRDLTRVFSFKWPNGLLEEARGLFRPSLS
jgi:tetratricopeptide (TPR) repeat protein